VALQQAGGHAAKGVVGAGLGGLAAGQKDQPQLGGLGQVGPQLLDASQLGAARLGFQGQIAAALLLFIDAVAGVVQQVRPEAAQGLADGRQGGVVQVLHQHPVGPDRLVQGLLNEADLLFGVQGGLVVWRGNDHQNAQGQLDRLGPEFG
jgi:hypothetical protein